MRRSDLRRSSISCALSQLEVSGPRPFIRASPQRPALDTTRRLGHPREPATPCPMPTLSIRGCLPGPAILCLCLIGVFRLNLQGVQKAAIKNSINLEIRATNLSGSLSSLISVAELASSISQDSIAASVTQAFTLSSVGGCLHLV